ncbi:uncharacterized protein LOC134528075 isoform X11 [Bacillus rossius redtenbacheri]
MLGREHDRHRYRPRSRSRSWSSRRSHHRRHDYHSDHSYYEVVPYSPSNRMDRYYDSHDDDDYDKDDDESEEELIPLPEELTRKFGKLTCELCLCRLYSVRQANMHYKGKQHEKKVMRYLEDWSSCNDKKIPDCWLKLVCKRK